MHSPAAADRGRQRRQPTRRSAACGQSSHAPGCRREGQNSLSDSGFHRKSCRVRSSGPNCAARCCRPCDGYRSGCRAGRGIVHQGRSTTCSAPRPPAGICTRSRGCRSAFTLTSRRRPAAGSAGSLSTELGGNGYYFLESVDVDFCNGDATRCESMTCATTPTNYSHTPRVSAPGPQ